MQNIYGTKGFEYCDVRYDCKAVARCKPRQKSNIRDYASINELICLSNMENLNAVFINDEMPQSERLIKLNKIAIQQMQILEDTGETHLLQ